MSERSTNSGVCMVGPTVCTSLGLLVLRVVFGVYMMTHGIGKVRMMLNGEWEGMGDPIGIGPHASMIGITVAEFFGPILVVVGLLTRFAALPTVFAMGVAAFVAHGSDPWTMTESVTRYFAGESESFGSKEMALLFAGAYLALVFTGAGRFSLDALIFGKKRPVVAGEMASDE